MLAIYLKRLYCLLLGAATLLLINVGGPGNAQDIETSAPSAQDCKGTITIGDEEVRRGKGWLRISSVEKVLTTGNCCWKLSERRGFRGQSHIIRPPHSSHLPDHVDWIPQSVLKVDC